MNAEEPIRPDRPDPLVPESTGSGTSGIDGLDGEFGADGHLGWRLSALLDGELPVADELRAREHLAGCDLCQDEFTEVMSARAFVRGLGDVEPPQGYLDRILTRIHRRKQIRLGLVSLVSFAALWIVVLIVAAGLAVPSVTPAIGDVGIRHEQASADPAAFGDQDGLDVIAADEIGSVESPFVLPSTLASSYERVAAWQHGGRIQALYESPTASVSVFEQAGSLDWSSLPDGGEIRQIDGERAWVATVHSAGAPDRHIVVVPEYPVVFTIVTTDAPDAALDVAADLPAPQAYGWRDRIRQNLERWLGNV